VAEVAREVRLLASLAPGVAAVDADPAVALSPRLELVRRAGCEAVDAGIERLFRLLALATTPKEMRDAYLSLRDASARGRATCVEFLDNVLPSALRALVVPVVEPAEARDRHRALMRLAEASPPASTVDALLLLARSDEPWLRAVAAAALLRQGLASAALPRRDADDDPRVQQVLAAAE
jgi:hypothetical protein